MGDEMSDTTPLSIDDYFDSLQPEARTALEHLRRQIRAAAPDADEVISYGMPTFKWSGKAFAGIAAFKKHCSYFPCDARLLGRFAEELSGFETSKGGIRVPFDKRLPDSLVEKLARARIEEIEEELKSKKAQTKVPK